MDKIKEIKKIRNFSIIAHIDHGKSTLSDRLIQICNGLNNNEIKEKILDSMDLEREKGITIKAQSVTLYYKSCNKQKYQLNLIDTPGHMDFAQEVYRSLTACEGVLLLIDAKKGIEAQTLANYQIAMSMNLSIIPVLNKIDLPDINLKTLIQEIKNKKIFNFNNIIKCSAKTGEGVYNILESIITNINYPRGNPYGLLQAIIIDSWFDNYFGVILLICIKNGFLDKNEKIKIINTGKVYNINKMGIFNPKKINRSILNCGEVGWISCRIKDIHGAPVGSTLTSTKKSSNKLLPGFKKTQPQIYASLFTLKTDDYKLFYNSINKLSLNDSSLIYEPENSNFLGNGFRCGFLGKLHMEVIVARLKREYNINVIVIHPTVKFELLMKNKTIKYINNSNDFPLLNQIIELREPISECNIRLPKKYLSNVINICIEKRGKQINLIYYEDFVELIYEIPMIEIIHDFYDLIKSVSNGFATLNYNFKYYQKSDLVLINILINNKKIDVLSCIIHKKKAYNYSSKFIKNLKNIIPRKQFNIIIQAAIFNKIIASYVIKQVRKNVTEKCYGGDVTRKKKLLNKQKKGKKKMKFTGNINVSREIFIKILKNNKNIRF